MTFSIRTSAGLTLVELLVSLLIAGVIFSGVVSVVSSSRETFESERESAFIQENARYAVEILSRDIRMAGSFGCALMDNESTRVANMVNDSLGGLFAVPIVGDRNGLDPITGHEGGLPASLGVSLAGSDAIVLRYADPGTLAYTTADVGAGTEVATTAHSFREKEKIAIVDSSCRHIGVFEHNTDSRTSVDFNVSGANCSLEIFSREVSSHCNDIDPSVGASYQLGSSVMRYVANAYFIAESDVLPGVNSLKRLVLAGGGTRIEELAQGVDSLSFMYAVDTDEDGSIDGIMDADQVDAIAGGNGWDNVISVRFSLVFKSQAEFFDTAQPNPMDEYAPDDKHLRQLVSATVAMRNRRGLLISNDE